ncbi:expressed unknown protein [Seminavis robusta]|uniref:Trafficking protein particle complex subunit 11 domain-containing protein n=1 Tax=Seminavis robusta TaxID=568900 RepID=A0A9N8EE90_9STRA|nr:expressed unknown protein [Seminavis robusta]|eukprot:Sro872_g213900.1 n/a (1401) ;mRNA; f:746-4948
MADDEDDDVKDKDVKMDAASIQFRTIRDGFAELRKAMDGEEDDNDDIVGKLIAESEAEKDGETEEGKADPKTMNNYVTVNFIDPTSVGDAKGKTPPAKAPLELYEKLTTAFEEEYRSSLRQVPYKHIRSGRNEVIEELSVKPVLTKSHATAGANGEALTPWGGTAAAAVSDPAEWHNGPFCHVYIAACENMHSYRNKVRPAVQAFVSQIESAANNYNSSSGDGSGPPSGGNYSSHYIIVFVPVGPRTRSESGEQSGGGRMGAALSRLATARQRMTGPGRDVPDNSVHSVATSVTDSSDMDTTDPLDVSMNSSTSASTSGMLFSKQDKELFRKFNSDFPNGTTCILSTLLDGPTPEDPKVATLKQQEWNSFMRALGNAIVDGFKDRCRRYDEELRRLQMLPGTAGANRSPMASRGRKGSDEQGSKRGGGMDLSYFFLVKESLAFTYEQMHLPTEALLQYSELRAFLPDIGEATIEERKKSRKRRSSLAGNSALEVAVAGDIQSFRKRMRTIEKTENLKPIAHVVEQYIFAREISLLFKMKQPVELVKRCHAFADTMYNFHLRAASHAKEDDEKQEQRNHAEEWALTFCWDVKCASEPYFTLMNPSSKASLYGEYAPVRNPDVHTILTERSLAREISSLLEFGRLRLLQLGDAKIEGSNPVRNHFGGTPVDMRKPWEPWDPSWHKDYAGKSSTDDENFYSSRDEFLDGVFSSPDSYVSKYVEMASAIATFGLFAGRQRIAARLQGELAEILICRGEYKDAINTLISTVNILGKDQWDKCHFWRLLRLASCQRRVGPPADYLKTLVNCFGPNISNVAPSKALGILLGDLEAVVGDESITGSLFRSVPFLAARLEVQKTSCDDEASMAFGPERKQLNKKFCTVGETVRITLTTSSFLPKAINVDVVNLSLVAFGAYAAKVESKTPIEKEDAFKVLSLESPTVIESGVNTFTFEWVPINTGQYILASIELKWKEASFFYDSIEMRRSLVGVDVLPSDPSQSITLEPYFLVPGNIQPVRIIFYSGSDVITKGTVNLTCTPGVMLIPPNEEETDDNWTESCTVKLPPCGTGETIVLTTSVRTPDPYLMPPTEEVQALSAKVATLYRHADYVPDSNEDESNMPCMKTVLEAMVPTLEKPVLTVEGADVFPTAVDGFLICVSLNCNSPVPYHVKSWLLELPQPIVIVDGGDLNQDLFDVPVVEGEVLSFGFTCRREQIVENKEGKMNEILEPALHVELEDEFGTVFNEVLAVDLSAFYADVKRDSKLSGFGSVAIELQDCAVEGVVGEPVNFKYSIDTSGLKSLQKEIVPEDGEGSPRFLYAIKYDEADWLVSGDLKGQVVLSDSGSFALTLVGIPTRPGSIKRFPKISLKCEVSKGDLLPLLVDMREPDKFSSRPFGGQMAVACPQRK